MDVRVAGGVGRRFAMPLPRVVRNPIPASLSSYDVVAVNPDLATMAPYPMPRPPDIIGATYIITRPARVVRSIADLGRDIPWTRSVAWVTRVIAGAVSRIRAIIISATACNEYSAQE